MRYVLAVLALAAILNILMWIFFVPWYINKRLDRFQGELLNRHYDEVDAMYRKMRGWRHDYHNHIQVLKAHMELGQYEQAADYLHMLEHDLAAVDTVLKTGNVMVDAILNSKLTMIREKEIAVNVTAIVPQNVGISGIDLSVIIGNLLDNAMEAAMQVKNPEDRFIRVYIDIVKKQLYISVSNSMAGKAKKNGMQYISQKKGVHGFGLLRIDSIIAKYNGYLNRQSEQGVFATEIMLPLVEFE